MVFAFAGDSTMTRLSAIPARVLQKRKTADEPRKVKDLTLKRCCVNAARLSVR